MSKHVGSAFLIALLVQQTFARLSVGPQDEPIDLSRYQHIIHVAPSGSDASGDGSAAKPWHSIEHALASADNASNGDRYAVLVAAGRYGGDSVQMRSNVDLIGGYESQDWTRDALKNPTILDGEKSRRILVGADHAALDGFILQNGKSNGPTSGAVDIGADQSARGHS